MRFFFISSSLILYALVGQCQFTYFNEIDQNNFLNTGTNIETIDEDLFVWGRNYTGENEYTLKKFDQFGDLLEQSILTYDNALIYIGETNSFIKTADESGFLYAHAITDTQDAMGYIIRFDPELDTLWTNQVDLFPPYTYYFALVAVDDGFVLAGEHGTGPGMRGTFFIEKVDLEGEYLWHSVIHEPEEGVFRNRDVSVVEEGYVVSGASGAGADTEGRIEFLDSSGQLQFTEQGTGGIYRLIMRHVVKENGEIVIAQPIGLVDYPGSSNPLITYSLLRILSLNIETEELTTLNEFMEGEAWISGASVKLLESQGGIVMLGNYYEEIDGTISLQSWIMKLDEEYAQEWYTELAYASCAACTNQLYDVVETSDGGYAMVGRFIDQDQSPLEKTWLVKVDACGDLEWQGCELADGLWDSSAPLAAPLSIYPNPAQDRIYLDKDDLIDGAIVSFWDQTGRRVLRVSYRAGQAMDVSSLANGLYQLSLDESDIPYTTALSIQR